MKKRTGITLLGLWALTGLGELFSQASFRVIDYYPAPGQFINLEASGTPGAADKLSSEEGGIVSLGGYGGFITLKMEEPVKNENGNPYGVDFTIFGNASSEFAEPGIVMVSKDVNLNGIPDDEWYEIAGSSHYFLNFNHGYSIRYDRPEEGGQAHIPWTDGDGKTGWIYTNSYHSQSYFPGAGFDTDFYGESCSFSGNLLACYTDRTDAFKLKSMPLYFGYADNHSAADNSLPLPDNPYTPLTEGMGGDAIDISWARDKDGNYPGLDQVDFIRIYTGCNLDFGALGELSTEFRKIVDIPVTIGITGEYRLLVIENLSPEILKGEYLLKSHYFEYGLPEDANPGVWEVVEGDALIDQNGLLRVQGTGKLEVKYSAMGMEARATSRVVNWYTGAENFEYGQEIAIIPSVFNESFKIVGEGIRTLKIADPSGRVVYMSGPGADYSLIYPTELPSGLYIAIIETEKQIVSLKIIKQEY